MYKAEEELEENADYLFPEIDNLDFEADLDKAFEEIEALHRDKNEDDSLEKAVSTEDIASAKTRGLVPKSGNWQKPGRWVRPEDADVPVDTGEKPRKKASVHPGFLKQAEKADSMVKDVLKGFPNNGLETLTEIYSTSLENFSTRISSVDGAMVRQVFDVGMQILGEEGQTVGAMVRQFSVKEGVLSVYHHSFMLDDDYQGKGLAADINEHVEEEYEKLGVSEIRLHANDSIGGYAWARQGYDFSEEDELEEMQSDFSYFIEQNWEEEEALELIDQIERFTHSWQFANWNPTDEPHGEHLGKKWMLGTNWNAKKKLDKKSAGYKIGKGYFAAKRNVKNTS